MNEAHKYIKTRGFNLLKINGNASFNLSMMKMFGRWYNVPKEVESESISQNRGKQLGIIRIR